MLRRDNVLRCGAVVQNYCSNIRDHGSATAARSQLPLTHCESAFPGGSRHGFHLLPVELVAFG
jgi:hypothetical protein